MNPIVEIVTDIYCTGTNYYNYTLFDHYIVYLEGYDEPFKMTKKQNKDFDFIPRIGDKITCTFDDGRLRNVKLMMEVIIEDDDQ